ncbi:unnamed protein product [Boreogadus saida]
MSLRALGSQQVFEGSCPLTWAQSSVPGSSLHHGGAKQKSCVSDDDRPLVALSDGGSRRPAEGDDRSARAGGVWSEQRLEVGGGSSNPLTNSRITCNNLLFVEGGYYQTHNSGVSIQQQDLLLDQQEPRLDQQEP